MGETKHDGGPGWDAFVIVNDEKTLRPAEHEIWLSFVGDDKAECFHDWWYARGGKEWAAYYQAWKEARVK